MPDAGVPAALSHGAPGRVWIRPVASVRSAAPRGNRMAREKSAWAEWASRSRQGLNASEIVECAQLAESLGYDSVWMAEGHGGDQFAILGAVAAQTERVKLGTCISSVFVRSAPTIAMSAAVVDQLSGGRFILGLGSSHKVQVEPEHGVALRQAGDAGCGRPPPWCAQLLRDGRVSFQGETVTIENYELWFEPLRPSLPIYFSGVRPKMIGVCGEEADGVILVFTTLDTGAEARQHIAAGAERTGRDPGAVDVTSLIPTAVADNPADAFDALRPGVAMYTGFFPRYNQMAVDQGFGEEAAAIAEAWSRGDHEAANRAVSDEHIDSVCIAGTPERCRERIAAYHASGIDLPMIAPMAVGPNAKEMAEAAIRACAPR